MEPRLQIAPQPYGNDTDAAFGTAFFRSFATVHSTASLPLTDEIVREYAFPTFYADVTYGMGLFTCSYAAARAVVADRLDPRMRPVRISRTRALLGVACYDYRTVQGMAPYSEMAVAIPVAPTRWWSRVPVLPLLPPLADRTGRFVLDMPMTSKENQIRGNQIWGLPKTTRRVDVATTSDEIVATAYDDAGHEYLELTLPHAGPQAEGTDRSWVLSRLGGRMVRSRSVLHGTFRTTTHLRRVPAPAPGTDRGHLWLGDGPAAAVLRGLDVAPVPFQVKTGERVSSAFDLPDHEAAR